MPKGHGIFLSSAGSSFVFVSKSVFWERSKAPKLRGSIRKKVVHLYQVGSGVILLKIGDKEKVLHTYRTVGTIRGVCFVSAPSAPRGAARTRPSPNQKGCAQ